MVVLLCSVLSCRLSLEFAVYCGGGVGIDIRYSVTKGSCDIIDESISCIILSSCLGLERLEYESNI